MSEDEKEITTANGLPVESMAGLFPKEGEEETSEPGQQAASEQAKEEVIDLDELSNRLGTTKVKVQIAGEEKLVSPAEAIRYQQKFSGLEKSTERKTLEASRILDEVRQHSQKIQEQVAGAATKDLAEPVLDDDSPEAFVDARNRKFYDETIKPALEQINNAVSSLATVVEPTIAESHKKSSVAILAKNGVEIDLDTFDSYHDKMVDHMERRVGRTLTEGELKKVQPGTWAQSYLVVSHGAGNGSPLPVRETVNPIKEVEKRKVVTSAGGGANPVGGNNGEQNLSVLTRQAQESGNWTEVLKARGVKPRSPGG